MNDIIGKRFGKLIVVGDSGQRQGRKILYLCKCDCGGTKLALSSQLKKGLIKSCGCLSSDRSNDVVGKRFGRLTVLKRSGVRGKNAEYLCKCDCGNTCKVLRESLLSGSTQSCGCLKKEAFDSEQLHESAGFIDGTCVSMFANAKLSSANTSGFRGVSWNTRRSRWVAQIKYKGKTYHLGYYKNISDAVRARAEAESQLGIDNFVEQYRKNQPSGGKQ